MYFQEPSDYTWHWPSVLRTRMQGKGCQPLPPSHRFTDTVKLWNVPTYFSNISWLAELNCCCRCDFGLCWVVTWSNRVDWKPRCDNTNHWSDHSSTDCRQCNVWNHWEHEVQWHEHCHSFSNRIYVCIYIGLIALTKGVFTHFKIALSVWPMTFLN